MKILFAFLILVFSVTPICIAQTNTTSNDSKGPIVSYLNHRHYKFPSDLTKDTTQKWPDTLYYNTVYKASLLGSPTIPISFSKVTFSKGTYLVSPTLSIGMGYTWFFGNFIFNENDKITVDPKLSFGFIADVEIQNNFNLTKPAGFFTGIFIGVQAFSLYGGYDLINKTPMLALGGRIDLYTLYQRSLRPIGKVHPVRKHKKAARSIDILD